MLDNDRMESDSKKRNPLNGVAILGGLLFIAFGMIESDAFVIAGTILFSGGLISYSIQEHCR